MPEATRFSAAELDQIEDALADPSCDLAALESHVRDEVLSLRAVEAWTSEALPLEAAPPSVFDAVMAEATQAAASPAPAAQAGSARPWRRWWPSVVGLAGSAALILVIVRGEDEASIMGQASTAPVAAAESAARDDVVAATPATPVASPEQNKDGAAQEAKELGTPAEFAAAAPEMELDAPADKGAPGGGLKAEAPMEEVATKGAARRRRSSGSGASARVPASAPAPKAAPKKKSAVMEDSLERTAPARGEARSQLAASGEREGFADEKAADVSTLYARAEALRRSGQCDRAQRLFARLSADPDARVSGRALVGLGLCAEAQGKRGEADAYFARARRRWPEAGRDRARRAPARSDAKTAAPR